MEKEGYILLSSRTLGDNKYNVYNRIYPHKNLSQVLLLTMRANNGIDGTSETDGNIGDPSPITIKEIINKR